MIDLFLRRIQPRDGQQDRLGARFDPFGYTGRLDPTWSNQPLEKEKAPEIRGLRASGIRDLNPRLSAWEADTLPAELIPRPKKAFCQSIP